MRWSPFSRLAFLAAVVALLWVGRGLREQATAGEFRFVGSDSYGYVKLADELLAHRRYALGPPPEPLHWARPPAFPLYVAIAKGRAEAKMTGGDGWGRIVRANLVVDVIGIGLVVCALAFAVAGPFAALLALALVMVSPWNIFAVPAALTETLASFLVTATIGACVPPALGSRRLGWLLAAGVLFALAVLTRPDSLLIAPALALAIYGAARGADGGWKRRLVRPSLALVLGFVVVYAPWPLRNLVAFDHPYPLGGRIDRYSRPVENYKNN